MNATHAWLTLNLLPGIGWNRAKALISQFGSPAAALDADEISLRGVPGLGSTFAKTIAQWRSTVPLEEELSKIERHRLTLVTPDDPAYPHRLKHIASPPLVLYVRGSLKEADRHTLAVVGSRRSTHYGLEMARKLSFQIASHGYTVASGLARGVDTAAHEGALAAKGRTLAVIGSGLGQIYPPENQALVQKIADDNGAVISELPVDCPPDKKWFPLRNRIVSGLSEGVLVIEAPGRSGALITAAQALEEGRNVYAVPGNIDRPSSLGCNRLIQQGAKLVVDASDIFEDLSSLFPNSTPQQMDLIAPASLPAQAAPQERAILEALAHEQRHRDELTALTKLPSADLLPLLTKLELRRWIKQLPGGVYVRLI